MSSQDITLTLMDERYNLQASQLIESIKLIQSPKFSNSTMGLTGESDGTTFWANAFSNVTSKEGLSSKSIEL